MGLFQFLSILTLCIPQPVPGSWSVSHNSSSSFHQTFDQNISQPTCASKRRSWQVQVSSYSVNKVTKIKLKDENEEIICIATCLLKAANVETRFDKGKNITICLLVNGILYWHISGGINFIDLWAKSLFFKGITIWLVSLDKERYVWAFFFLLNFSEQAFFRFGSRAFIQQQCWGYNTHSTVMVRNFEWISSINIQTRTSMCMQKPFNDKYRLK